MKTPFEILGVPEDADDRQIKKAYLDAVRRYPPEQHPKRFHKIREAYERIATEKARIGYMLFDISLPDPAEIVDALMTARGRKQGRANEKIMDLLDRSADACCKRFDL